jgi:hypothetical protein
VSNASPRRTTARPLALGVGVALIGIFGPSGMAVVLGFLAAGIAGWVSPADPVRAGGLVFSATGLLAIAAPIFRDVSWPTAILAIIGGFMWSLVASHFGAGLALRRSKSQA